MPYCRTVATGAILEERDTNSSTTIRRFALVLASAALFTVAYPPIDQRWTAPFALVPLLIALRGTSLPLTVALSVVWSLASMCVGITDWLVGAVVVYYRQSAAVGVGMLVGTTLVGATIEYVAFALCYRGLARKLRPSALVPLTAAVWDAAELCRTRIGFGNPWGVFGYSIVQTNEAVSLNDPWLLISQVADLGGIYAVSFVLVALNAAIAEVILARIATRPPREVLGPAVVGTLVLLATVVYGRDRVSQQFVVVQTPVAVALVQPNLDLGSQWSEEFYGQNLREYLELSEQAAEQYHPELVFWPENSMTFFVDREPAYRQAMATTLDRANVELVAGAPRFEDPNAPVYFNSVFLLSPDGQIRGTYDKRRLLPFAEYFPLRSVELLRRSFGRIREFDVGQPEPPLRSRAGKIGVIICNEAMYPRESRARVLEGAELLANLSNDTWVGDVEFAEHQFRIAAIRAVEQRRYLLRASTSGPSGIVEPSGRVQTRSVPYTRTVLGGTVAPRSNLTVYAHIGDLFAWLCLGLVVFILIVPPRIVKRN